jgi:hypothetical protein
MATTPAPPGLASRWEQILRASPVTTGLHEPQVRDLVHCSLADLIARTRAQLNARITEAQRLQYLAACALPGGPEAGQIWAEHHLPGRDQILQEAATAVLTEIGVSPGRYLARHPRQHVHEGTSERTAHSRAGLNPYRTDTGTPNPSEDTTGMLL